MKTTKRIEYIDITRGIAMMLVILGHCNMFVHAPLNKFILSFHMPLFFFVSGIFAKNTFDKEKLMGGVKLKIKTLLLPQVVLIIIDLIKPLLKVMTTNSVFDFSIFDPFAWNHWFLPVLFICSVIQMFLAFIFDMSKIKNRIFCLLATVIAIPLSIFVNRYGYVGFFHCLQIVPTALTFYLFGSIMRPYVMRLEQMKTIGMSVAAIIALCMCFIIAVANTPVMMYANDYGKYLLFVLCSLLGCFFTIYFSMFIKDSKLLIYVGTKSIAFYVWQGLVSTLSLSISYRIVTGVFHITNTNVISLFAFSIALVILLVIVRLTISIFPQIYGMK